jgi:hypothetical protein
MQRAAVLFAASMALPRFATLSHKRRDFRKKVTEHKMCVSIFPTIFVSNISQYKRIQGDIAIDVKTSSCKVPVILDIF